MSGYPPRRPPPLGRPPKPPAPVETSEQMHARWEREAEADEVAVTLGLAFRGETQGIRYWRGDGSALRAGYEAGKAGEREACAQMLDSIATEGSFDPEGLRTLRDAIAGIRARGEPNGQSSKG